MLPADFMPNSSSTRFYKRDTKDECPDMLAAPVTLTPTHTRKHARHTHHAHTHRAGRLVIELFEKEAPKAVENFKVHPH